MEVIFKLRLSPHNIPLGGRIAKADSDDGDPTVDADGLFEGQLEVVVAAPEG